MGTAGKALCDGGVMFRIVHTVWISTDAGIRKRSTAGSRTERAAIAACNGIHLIWIPAGIRSFSWSTIQTTENLAERGQHDSLEAVN